MKRPVFPKEENDGEGIIEASFSVDADGTVKNITCKMAPNVKLNALKEKVFRILSDMPQWQKAKKPIARQQVIVELRQMETSCSETPRGTYIKDEFEIDDRFDTPHIVIEVKPDRAQ